jgi:predicted ferric reductase
MSSEVTAPRSRQSIPPGRLSGRNAAILFAICGIAIVFATGEVVPASSPHQAELRIWLAARAAGFLALGLLAVQVCLGLILSHPINKSTWKLSRALFPWHENVSLFVLAFVGAHVLSLGVDRYANVGPLGAVFPGLSAYRSAPVALGTLSLWALLITALTARYTRLLPMGAWLLIHRCSIAIFALAWLHGVLAGSDSVAFAFAYGVTGAVVGSAAVYRYWVSRRSAPTFAGALQETDR